MVKGISKQVIVVHSPDKDLFDQAIFILSDEAVRDHGVTDDMLLREAKRLIRTPTGKKKGRSGLEYFACALLGAMLTGAIWLLTVLI